MDSLKVIDLFSGAGGLSQGLEMQADVISAVEIDKNLSQTYRKISKKLKYLRKI